MTINGIRIEFVPAHATEYKYIVCREYEDLYFYYGAYNDEHKAQEVVAMVGGYAVYNR